MLDVTKMTDAQITALMRQDCSLNRARVAFSSACGKIEQGGEQRTPITIFDVRRIEYEAVQLIAEIMNNASTSQET